MMYTDPSGYYSDYSSGGGGNGGYYINDIPVSQFIFNAWFNFNLLNPDIRIEGYGSVISQYTEILNEARSFYRNYEIMQRFLSNPVMAEKYFEYMNRTNGHALLFGGNSYNEYLPKNNSNENYYPSYNPSLFYVHGNDDPPQNNQGNGNKSSGNNIGATGHIISVANAASALGPAGAMVDVGGVIDSYGNTSIYFTIGWLFGYGACAGLGYSATSKNFNLNNFKGESTGFILTIPGFKKLSFLKILSIDGTQDITNDYYGLNYKALGLNIGVGVTYGLYKSYTFLIPTPPPDFWCKPWRHF